MRTVIEIPPWWTVALPELPEGGTGIRIVIEPKSGFGDGTHETTQLCMQAIATLAPRDKPAWRMLDFGSGSAILAIAVAKLGASVDAVEIDDAAIAGAARNARFNGVVDRIVFTRRLEDAHGPYELIVANILCAVLLDHADRLVQRISPGGTLVLSGLVSTDVPAVSARFASLLFGRRPEVYERGDWRALVWRSG